MYQGKYAASTPKEKRTPAPKAGATAGTKVFYSIYLAVILVCVIGIGIGLFALNNWLVSYEASQPDTKAQQTFEQLFASPDWKSLYATSGMADTKFETADTFAAYMEQKVAGSTLTYSKTSAGLTGGRKYLIKLGDENLAAFTLKNSVESDLEIPNWELSTVEFFVEHNASVTIHTQPGHTVSINGVVLDETCTVRTTSTVAEDYLPEGVYGARTATLYVDGLLTAPTVTVTDENGAAVELAYDAATRTYSEVAQDDREIPDTEYNTALSAAKAYCQHMIGAGGGLSTYFDTASDTYKSITRNELWFRGYTGYDFSNEIVSDYYPYTDSLCSVRVSLSLNVHRANGTVKAFDVDNTLFLSKNASGKWKVIEMTNVDVQEIRAQVRLSYFVDGQMISSEMVNADISALTPPVVNAPEGKVFAGWFLETTDESGSMTYTLAFTPDENGTVQIPGGYTLEPMTLHALFKDA